ncbi:DUF2917 domain-containing protein [Cupriavidus taiwanensis]|uniref:DUF2917 domain-containing protein n=1 Tax=Cupriavidus taiwanensis TaxID=164546 RepID=UPI001571DE5E|nr:DUF2917 domain-containing protein [Cupriavidus taiwanensis]MDK3023458.1 DUF2917 domain-containing protein [Cupriavidus taiwanensis]NSX15217.1 DUF2917 domain-containing protein [Cupriavidus taiwanensis]
MYLVSNDMTATLPARSSLRLVAGPGEQVAVRCTAGELWLIRDGDPKDTALTASECFTLSDTGHIELYAITAASLHVTRCKPAAGSIRGAWRERLWRWLAPRGYGYPGPGR